MKHVTGDVLKKLGKLQKLHLDVLYKGERTTTSQYLADPSCLEFWGNYLYLALAAGLEWAVLQQVRKVAADAGSAQ